MEACNYCLTSADIIVPKPLHIEMHVILLDVTLFIYFFFLILPSGHYVDMREKIMRRKTMLSINVISG